MNITQQFNSHYILINPNRNYKFWDNFRKFNFSVNFKQKQPTRSDSIRG